MTTKLVAGLVILLVIGVSLFLLLDEYVETVEDLTEFTGDMLSSTDISDGIEVLYEFEEFFYEKEMFMSLFVHDGVLDELKLCTVDIRSAYFNGDRTFANSQIVLLREMLLQLRKSILPSIGNIM